MGGVKLNYSMYKNDDTIMVLYVYSHFSKDDGICFREDGIGPVQKNIYQ